MTPDLANVTPGWRAWIEPALRTEDGRELLARLADEASAGHVIYPNSNDIFCAFRYFEPAQTKIVILGQDPYHGAGQAMGLSFSVCSGMKLPPSLRNIFKEISNDIGKPPTSDGDLTRWAEQGVLLLNASLSVRAASAGAHARFGWQSLTDQLIIRLANSVENIVFMLWGNHAIAKEVLIEQSSHLTLKAPHPSPLSAHRGFLGCRHFSQANDYLLAHGRGAIDW